MDELTEIQLKKRLSHSISYILPWPVPSPVNLRKAAVLIPFQKIDSQWFILFTRRTELVQDHKGQVSFPGGVQDIDDLDEVDTALREAYEEIGLNHLDATVLGRMSDIPTMSNYLITPIVAVIPHPYLFTLSPQEVDRIFSIPLVWLANPSNHYEKERFLQNGISTNVIYFREYEGELLWGITAYLVLCLIDLIK